MSRTIQLAHGSGGKLSRELIEKEIVPRFGDGPLAALPDGASLQLPTDKIIYSTDSFVVQPLQFPGGNIGDLAVYGTVNDIAVSGGRPLWLSLSFILEEGLPLSVFRTVLDSIKMASERCEVLIVTGDTKVVGRGQCDQMFVNTSGIGEALPGFSLNPSNIEAGDLIVVNGSIADHGMAVLTAREDLKIENGPLSDTAPVHKLVQEIEEFGSLVKVMRDPTSGGLSSVLNELVAGQAVGVLVKENRLPIAGNVKAVAEMLGMDLLHVASEGKVVAVCCETVAQKIVERWRQKFEGRDSTIIGHVTEDAGKVVLETLMGGKRLVSLPEGELLPRIC